MSCLFSQGGRRRIVVSKKLPFSRSLCPFCAALEREQNSVDSKISAGAPGLRGTGKRSGKGARFPSAWREQALVSGVSMGQGKANQPFQGQSCCSRRHTLETMCRWQRGRGKGAGWPWQGRGEESYSRLRAGGRAPAPTIPPPWSTLRGAGTSLA